MYFKIIFLLIVNSCYNTNIYMDFDDFQIKGLVELDNPYVECLEVSENYKKFIFHLSESVSKKLIFSKVKNKWIRYSTYKEGEFQIKREDIIDNNQIISVEYNAKNNLIYTISIRNNGVNKIKYYSFIKNKVNYNRVKDFNSVLNLCDEFLVYEYSKIKSEKIILSVFKNNKIIEKHCYKGKKYKSLTLFLIDNNYFCGQNRL